MMTQSDILAHKIIDCATAVHNILGGGFQEVTYQRALAVEMGKLNLRFRDSTEVPVYHSEIEIGTKWVDFFVENMITVEIMAMDLSGIAGKQDATDKMEAYHFPRNILINFGGSNLEFDRVCNKKFRKRKPM